MHRNITGVVGFVFQSTLPQGERLCGNVRLGEICNFNPRSHKGSDDTKIKTDGAQVDFNPRSHKGSDGDFLIGNSVSNIFQSTLPQGERP